MASVPETLIEEFRDTLARELPAVERINGFTYTADYGPGGWGPLWFFSGIVVGGRERSYHAIKPENVRTIDRCVRSTLGSIRDQGVGDMISRSFRADPTVVPRHTSPS